MNVPKLRFKDFKDGWTKYKLNDFLDLLTDYDANGSFADMANNVKTYDNENYAWYVRSTDLENNSPLNKVKYTDKKSYDFLRKTALYGDEVLMAKRGNIGNVYFFKPKTKYATLGPNCYLLKTNNKINNYFLYSYFKSTNGNKKLNRLNASSTLGALYKDDVKNINLTFPEINEQNKIAKTLELLDKKIELQSKKIEDLKLFKLYSENKLLNSNGSIYWKKIKLNDILIEGNKEPVKNTNDFKKITIKLNLNGLEFNESKRETSDRRPFYIREENEIIIGKQNYFNGSIAIVTKKFSGCICSNAIMSFKVKEGYNLKYIYLYLSQKRYMKEREFLANGTGQKELSEKEFLKFTIKVPEDSVVKKITNIIEKINKKINFENNKLNKLIELKKGLMQNMFV